MPQRMLSRIGARLARGAALALVASAVAHASGPAAVASASPLESIAAPPASIPPGARPATERPLDLADPTPRPIRVRFEVSPPDEPGRLDATWSVARAATLEPVADRGLVRIAVPAREVEAQLRSTGTDALAGSFSDFVWLLDPETGEVVEATLSGRVRESIRLGPLRTSAVVEIDVAMSTARSAGFDRSRFLGLRTNALCEPPAAGGTDASCVGVPAVPFDPSRGYVNAVGRVQAASSFAKVVAFSPLGEIQLTESGPGGTDVVVTGPTLPGAVRSAHAGADGPLAGPSQAEALCSQPIGPACPADLGGES